MSAARSRRDVPAWRAKRDNNADATGGIDTRRPSLSRPHAATSPRPRCHKTVIKPSLQVFERPAGEISLSVQRDERKPALNRCFRAGAARAIIGRDEHRLPLGGRVGAAAGLSRQPCAGQRHRAGAGSGHQPAARHPVGAPAGVARRAADARQRGADHSRPGAAGAVLSAVARARRLVATPVRRELLRARLPALGAGARALFDAAGAAQHRDRLERHRSAPARGRALVRRGPLAAHARHRSAARHAGDHGRHPHLGGVGDRHRHAVDADRPDQFRQLHLRRPANAELGLGRVRLRGRRRAGAGGRSNAGADGARRCFP